MLNKKLISAIGIAATLTLLAGCSSIGPRQIHLDRGSYNDIVRQTDYQQLLGAIVSIAYLETASSSLSVTNVTSSYSLSENINVSPSWSHTMNMAGQGEPTSSSITQGIGGTGVGATYTDSPTISYAPVSPQQFVTVMQQPVTLADLSILFDGGIDNFDVLARLLFNQVGDLENAAGASDPLLTKPIVYKDYYRFVTLTNQMLLANQAKLKPIMMANIAGLMLNFNPAFISSQKAIEIKKMLHVPADSQYIIFARNHITNLTVAPGPEKLLVPAPNSIEAPNVIYLETRSLYGILSFLSHSVVIPPEDIKNHLVQQLIVNGKPFDWSPLLHDLMAIYSSESEPYSDVFVKTHLYGHWFYIKQSDLKSKLTFMLIIRLINLNGGNTSSTGSGPTLSLPV